MTPKKAIILAAIVAAGCFLHDLLVMLFRDDLLVKLLLRALQ